MIHKIRSHEKFVGKVSFTAFGDLQLQPHWSIWHEVNLARGQSGTSLFTTIIGKDRDPLMRDPQIVSFLSLIEARISLIDYYISLLSLIKALFQRVSKWGSLSFPMTQNLFRPRDHTSNSTLPSRSGGERKLVGKPPGVCRKLARGPPKKTLGLR